MTSIDKSKMRWDTPQVGEAPYRQVHAHSTGNKRSTVYNEADYMYRKDLDLGFYTHVVGNGIIYQTAQTDRGAWDVGGGWNYETYAAVELIESHSSKEEFLRDYYIYVELLRQLADEAGIPKTLDTSDLSGIKTHYHCTYNQPDNHSDHVDPYTYLESWGISKSQFKKDIENGVNRVDTWRKNSTGWWYEYSDGSYPKNKWLKINNEWFYFDNSGYCLISKWFKYNNKWYYLDARGAMVTGWKFINNYWYFFNKDGDMQTGWIKYKETWYYLDPKDGNMLSNTFIKSGNGWYRLNNDGTLNTKPEFTIEPEGLITVK